MVVCVCVCVFECKYTYTDIDGASIKEEKWRKRTLFG